MLKQSVDGGAASEGGGQESFCFISARCVRFVCPPSADGVLTSAQPGYTNSARVIRLHFGVCWQPQLQTNTHMYAKIRARKSETGMSCLPFSAKVVERLSNRSQSSTPGPSDKARHERLSSHPAKHFKTCSPILYLGTVSGPINLTSSPPPPFFFFFYSSALPTLKQRVGSSTQAFFCARQRHTFNNARRIKKKRRPSKNVPFHSSAPVSGRIFSISQVDFARLIKSSSLMSCLTSPPSLLRGAYIPAGATSQTDCCPAGMGLAARQGLRGPPSLSFCLNLKCRVGRGRRGGAKQAEGIEVIPSSSGAAPHTRENPPVNH